MTARKPRANVWMATEDAFGTPPVARSGMMCVAGSIEDDESLPLLTDDSITETVVVRIRLGELRQLIHRTIEVVGS